MVLRESCLAAATTLDKGPLGEVSAQALLAMAVDTAQRTKLLHAAPLAVINNQADAFGNFVHLADFLEVLFDGGSFQNPGEWKEALVELNNAPDFWLNFSRFAKTSLELSATSISQAFLWHEELSLRECTPNYDLFIPVYCGPLNQPHDQSKYSFATVQAKTGVDQESRHLQDIQIRMTGQSELDRQLLY